MSAAVKYWTDELAKYGATMNAARAHYVRWLRSYHRCTWAAVGREVAEQWQLDVPGFDKSLLGRAACEAAARQLNEDPNEEPWN